LPAKYARVIPLAPVRGSGFNMVGESCCDLG